MTDGVQNAHLSANAPPQASPQPCVGPLGPPYWQQAQQARVPLSNYHVPQEVNPHEAIYFSQDPESWDSQQAAQHRQFLSTHYNNTASSYPQPQPSPVFFSDHEKPPSDSQQSAQRDEVLSAHDLNTAYPHYQPSPDLYSSQGTQPSAYPTTSQLNSPPSVQQCPITHDRNHYGSLNHGFSADNNETIGQAVSPHIYNQGTQLPAYQPVSELRNPFSVPEQHPTAFPNLHSVDSAPIPQSSVSVLDNSFSAYTRRVNPPSQLPPPLSADQLPSQPQETSSVSSERVRTLISASQPVSQPSENNHASQQNQSLPAPTEAPAQQSDTMPGIQLVLNFDVNTRSGSYTVKLSIPAKGTDIEKFRADADRARVREYVKNTWKPANKDARVVVWYNQVDKKYWDLVMNRFEDTIPPGMSKASVRTLLLKSHPCINDPWTGHYLYKFLLGKHGGIPKLEAWMYGEVAVENGPATPYATWKDTLRSKVAKDDQKVPWVPQESLVAIWIILKKGCPETVLSELHKPQEKWAQLNRCKLTHLIPDPESVATPDPFWDGFLEELEEDPEQESLHDKVIAEGPAPEPADDQHTDTERLLRRIQKLEDIIAENGIEIPESEDDDLI